ncbi:MAG: hypothetical protein H6617_08875 [Bdellovibrionaceae bacterium]|nr:hypothetical protein [Bdellovibrionales bacterium]MCB9254780.1 hypothetical protein [Pseudobdellovibrionaceae bacterium]
MVGTGLRPRLHAVVGIGLCVFFGAFNNSDLFGADGDGSNKPERRRFLTISACANEIHGAATFGDKEHTETLPPAAPALDMWGKAKTKSPDEIHPTPKLSPDADPNEESVPVQHAEVLELAMGGPEPHPNRPRSVAGDTSRVTDGSEKTDKTQEPSFTPTPANDAVPMEFPEAVVERAQMGLHNEWQLLFGGSRHAPLHEMDFDITVLLRSPNLQILTFGNGVAVPESIREARRSLLDQQPREVYTLNAQIQVGLQELGEDYKPSWDQELIQAFVMMDGERSWTGPTRQLLRNLTAIHELSSESYVRDQDKELDLGRAQDNLANWLRRLLFRMVAGNVVDNKFAPMAVYETRLDPAQATSLEDLAKAGAIDSGLVSLYQVHDYALLDAVRELHARMTLPSKSALSVASRVTLKALVESLQEIEDEVLRAGIADEGEFPVVWNLDPRSTYALQAEADEKQFSLNTNGGKVVQGDAYRTQLKLSYRNLLKGLCSNDKMREHVHRYAENLGLALRWLRRAEKELIVEKERYTAHSTAAEIAQHAVAMVALPRRAGGLLLPDSIAVDGWIKILPSDLREIGLLIIDYHDGYEDPFTNEWVSLSGRTAREVLYRTGSREEREQIIAAQFFTRARMNAARKAAGVHYLRALRDSIRNQVEEKRGVKVWQAVATRAEAMEKVAVARAVSTVTDYLGKDTPLAELVEAADLENKKQGKEPAKPLSELIPIEECHLPPAQTLAQNLLDTWNPTVLGARPQGPNRGYVPANETESFIASLSLEAIPKTALARANTLITSIFERLDEISWRVYEANITARRTRNVSRSTATTQAGFDEAEKAFRETLARDYDASMQQLQTYFTKFHRSVRVAFIEAALQRKQGGKASAAPVRSEASDEEADAESAAEAEVDPAPEQVLAHLTVDEIARAKQEADVTILHMITPYEALIWCILQGETNTNQRFLNDLARHILRQTQNWNGQRSLDGNRPRPGVTRRELMWRSGLSLGAAILSSAVTWGVTHWLTTPDDADRSRPAIVQPADETNPARVVEEPKEEEGADDSP